MTTMYESALERAIVERTKKLGGRAFKWVSPGQAGVPDRICIFPGGRVLFVELKRPGLNDGRSVRQKKMFSVLEGLGCRVARVASMREFEEAVNDL